MNEDLLYLEILILILCNGMLMYANYRYRKLLEEVYVYMEKLIEELHRKEGEEHVHR